jgi:hypothetical protein
MPEKEERAALARELIAEIASEWEDTPEAFKSERDGRVIFTFVINQHNGSSVVNYDPQTEAEQILEDSGLVFGERVIRHMLATAKQHFANSLWQLREIALAQVHLFDLEFLGTSKNRKDRIKAVTALFTERLQEQLGGISRGADTVLSDLIVYNAVLQFREFKVHPSQNKLAEVLRVSPKTLREWRKKRGFNTHETFLKAIHVMRAGRD